MKAHKVMTPEEYAAMPIIGWHEVCRNVDGFGGVGIRFLPQPGRVSVDLINIERAVSDDLRQQNDKLRSELSR